MKIKENKILNVTAERRTIGQTKACIDCGEINWTQDDNRGEVYCGSCGTVVEQNVIDEGPEWTNHSDGPDKSRVGGPSTYLLADKGLNTTIDTKDLLSSSASRHGIVGKNRRDWRRRAIIDQRSKTRDGKIRNLTKATQLIRDNSGLHGRLVEEAAFYYRKVEAKGLVIGRSIAGVAAACVYLAAREAKLPRSISELSESFEIKEKELKRIIRYATRILGLHHVTGPEEYLSLFHSNLQLPPAVLEEANYIWSKVRNLDYWQGKKPSGVAGALMYNAAKMRGNPRTQAEICEVANISEVTLRGLLKVLRLALKQVGEATEN
tara:strand:+ start:4208 stop:5170 length:963 start_codon:yes stop_codon:yes gene_type:complete